MAVARSGVKEGNFKNPFWVTRHSGPSLSLTEPLSNPVSLPRFSAGAGVVQIGWAKRVAGVLTPLG